MFHYPPSLSNTISLPDATVSQATSQGQLVLGSGVNYKPLETHTLTLCVRASLSVYSQWIVNFLPVMTNR